MDTDNAINEENNNCETIIYINCIKLSFF